MTGPAHRLALEACRAQAMAQLPRLIVELQSAAFQICQRDHLGVGLAPEYSDETTCPVDQCVRRREVVAAATETVKLFEALKGTVPPSAPPAPAGGTTEHDPK